MATQHSRQGEQNHFYGKDQTGRKKGSNNNNNKNNYEKYVTEVERSWQRQSEQRCRSLRMRGNSKSSNKQQQQRQRQRRQQQQQQPRKEMAVKVARQMAKGRGVANEQSTERRGYRMVSMKTQAARDEPKRLAELWHQIAATTTTTTTTARLRERGSWHVLAWPPPPVGIIKEVN